MSTNGGWATRFNGYVAVGHFETAGFARTYSDTIGFYLQEGYSDKIGTMRVSAGIHLNSGGVALGPILILTNDVDYSCSYTWDPTAGTNGLGRLVCSVQHTNGWLAQSSLDLGPGSQSDNAGFAGNAFGLSTGYFTSLSPSNTNTVDVWLSDWIYSTTPKPPPIGPYARVLLLFGQSNARMAHSSYTVVPASKWADANTFYFSDPEFVYLRPGTPFHNFFGPEVTAAPDLADALQAQVCVIKWAIGGRGLEEEFLPEANLSYQPMVAMIKRAVAQLDRPVWIGGFPVQGENDSSDAGQASRYLANMNKLFNALRVDLGAPDLQFYPTRLQSWINRPYRNVVRIAQQNFPFIDLDDLTQLGDGVHISAAGGITMGHRMAALWLSLNKAPVFRQFGDQLVLFTIPGTDYLIEESPDLSQWEPGLPSALALQRGAGNATFYRARVRQ